MFKTIDELKSFITWSKSHKVKRIKVDNIEIELSELAFIVEEQNNQSNNSDIIEKATAQVEQEDEDELLYASSTGPYIG